MLIKVHLKTTQHACIIVQPSQPIMSNIKVCIIILLYLFHFEECCSSEVAVTTSLMLCALSLQLNTIKHIHGVKTPTSTAHADYMYMYIVSGSLPRDSRRLLAGLPLNFYSSSWDTWRRRVWEKRWWATQRNRSLCRVVCSWWAGEWGSQSHSHWVKARRTGKCTVSKSKASNPHLANVSHVVSSDKTRPDEVRSSANLSTWIPSSSCLLNWIPASVSMSIESWAYMSTLQTQRESETT